MTTKKYTKFQLPSFIWSGSQTKNWELLISSDNVATVHANAYQCTKYEGVPN